MTRTTSLASFFLASSIVVVAACDAPPGEETSNATSAQGTYAGERLSPTRVGQLARDAGVPCGEKLVLAVAVAWGESEGYTRAEHWNPDSVDRGLWQINSRWWPQYSHCVWEPTCNARAMAEISNYGSSWSHWLAYTNGRYQQFMAQGREGAAGACNGSSGGSAGSSTGGSTGGSSGSSSGGAAGSCSELGYEGKCEGDVSIWSDNDGSCKVRDCAGEGKTCGHISSAVGYGCLGGTSGARVSTCGSFGWEGKCFGDTLVWVERDGTCRSADCAARGKTCGEDGTNGNNCK